MSNALITPPDSPRRTANPLRPHRVLVVGGSYTGISALVNLLDLIEGKPNRPAAEKLPELQGLKPQNGIEITLLDTRDGYSPHNIFSILRLISTFLEPQNNSEPDHTVGSPLAHVSSSHVRPFWKTYRSIRGLQHPNLSFVQGTLQKLDCENLLATYLTPSGTEAQLPYDFLLLASGVKRDWPIVPIATTRKDYISHAEAEIARITAAANTEGKKVVVIGGGAVGIEFAGEIKVNHPELHVVLIHSRRELLSSEDLHSDFKDRALKICKEEGIEVILGNRAIVSDADKPLKTVTLADGRVIKAGHVINAVGKTTPASSMLPASALDENNFVKVTEHLSLPPSTPNAHRHYAAGDVIAWSGVKRAGSSMIMGHVAITNLYRELLLEDLAQNAKLPERMQVSQQKTSDYDPADPMTPHSVHGSPQTIPARLAADPVENVGATGSTSGDEGVEQKMAGLDVADGSHSDLDTTTTTKPDISQTLPASFPPLKPMMGLAIGTQAVGWNPYSGELSWGKNVMEQLFGEDLGWGVGLRFLRLGEGDEEGED